MIEEVGACAESVLCGILMSDIAKKFSVLLSCSSMFLEVDESCRSDSRMSPRNILQLVLISGLLVWSV